MAGTNGASLKPPALSPRRREKAMPDSVLGMLIFVATEIMFFAGLMSAHTITRAGAYMGVWPPADQPRLPIYSTAINTMALLLSGVALYLAHRAFRQEPKKAIRPMVASLVLGAFFVVFQGYEWVGLLHEGLTVTSSTHGAFFYVIVGMHALHAVIALVWLAQVTRMVWQGKDAKNAFLAAQVFWYFVVLLWPLIYARVYF